MKICINALGLKPATTGGLEIYFLNLIKSLCDFDKENEYYIFLNNKSTKKTIQPYINSRIKLVYFSQLYTSVAGMFLIVFTRPKTLYRLLVKELYRVLFSKNIYEVDTTGIYGKIINLDRFGMDVIHFPFGIIDPSFFNIDSPIVLTIPDIQHEYYPDFFDKETLDLRRKLYKSSAERADIIIAISEATRNTIVEKYCINPEKIVVTYPGCSKDFIKIDDIDILNTVRERYSLPGEFLFYPAGTWPHKNHIKLLEALAILKEKYSFEKRLIMTGIAQNNFKNVTDSIEILDLGNQVAFLHFVPFDDLPIIYNLATMMVFPSLFEGFGIPLLEAMNVGLPIVSSDRTSIPEVVGDAGVYFNPDSAEDMAEKIYHLWRNNNLKESLVRKGHEKAKLFTPKNTAEKTITAYKLAKHK